MTTLKDLKFEPHSAGLGGEHALIFFPNGYGASVILGSKFYSNGVDTYELAVIRGKESDWSIDYTTHITNDVEGYQLESEINTLLTKIEGLKELPNDKT